MADLSARVYYNRKKAARMSVSGSKETFEQILAGDKAARVELNKAIKAALTVANEATE